MSIPKSALFVASIALVTSLCPPTFAETTKRVLVMDRVVAVVGDEIVTLVELRRRALPLLLRIRASVDEAARPVAEAEMYRETLKSMVEDRLILRFARSKQISVSSEEINAAAEDVAKANHVKIDELYEKATEQGLDRASYRDELARQILRYKVLRQITPSRVFEENRGKPDGELTRALDESYKHWIEQQKQEAFIEVRL